MPDEVIKKINPSKGKLSEMIAQAGEEVIGAEKKSNNQLSDDQLLKAFGGGNVEKKSPVQTEEAQPVQEKSQNQSVEPFPGTGPVVEPAGNPSNVLGIGLNSPSTQHFLDYLSKANTPKKEVPTKPTLPSNFSEILKKQTQLPGNEQEIDKKIQDDNEVAKQEVLKEEAKAEEDHQKELDALDNGTNRTNNFMAKVNQAFYGLPADVLETYSILNTPLKNAVNRATGEPEVKVEDDPVYKAAQWYRDSLKEIAPDNPAFQEELSSQVGTAVGDLAGLVISGGTSSATELGKFTKASNTLLGSTKEASKMLTTPPALLGAMKTGVNEFKQAKEGGATDEEAFGSFIRNAATGGVLESIPIMKYFKRLNTTTGGGVVKMLKNGTVQGVDEMTTEIAQQVYSNVDAKQTYDKTREWYDGLTEAGGIGFGLGFALGAMGTSLRKKHAEAKTDESKAEIQKAIDFVDEKSTELKAKTEAVDNESKIEQKQVEDAGETNTTTDPGKEQTVDIPKQEISDSGSDSKPINQSVEEPIAESSDKKERQSYTNAKNREDLSQELKDGISEEARTYETESHAEWEKAAEDIIKTGIDEAKQIALDSKSDISNPVRVKLIKRLGDKFDAMATQAKKDGDTLLENQYREEATKLYDLRLLSGTDPGKTIAAYHEPNGRQSPTERLVNAKKQVQDNQIEVTKPHEEHIQEVTGILNKLNNDAISEVLKHPKIQSMLESRPAVKPTGTKKHAIDSAVDFLEKLKIDTKGIAGDVTYLLPAHVYNGAITAIQKGLQAGHSISKSINQAISEIRKTHKGDFDEAGFRAQFDDHLKKYEGHLDSDKAIKRALKEHGTTVNEIIKKHYTNIESAKQSIVEKLVKEAGLDEASAKELATEIQNKFDKLTKAAKEKALKKAKTIKNGSTKPRLKQSIDQKLIEMSNTGALSDEGARSIYSDKLGVKEITEAESKRIIELGEKIQEADNFRDEAEKDFTPANVDKYIKLKKERQDSINEIADMLSEKKPKDVWQTLATIMQGNLLSPISLVTNVYSNGLLMPLRFLSRGLASYIDFGYSKYTGKPRKIDILAANKGYWKGSKEGFKEGLNEVKTGTNLEDMQRLEVSRGFKPIQAFLKGINTKEHQALDQRVNNLIEGTFGVPAEGMFRMLNFGDKPFQRASEFAKANELASLKGLEGEERLKFLVFPDKESANLIKQAGEEATFKSDNAITKTVGNFLNSINTGLGNVPIIGGPLKLLAKTQTPFVKTPLNIIIETMDFAVPPMSIAKSIYYARQGDRVKSLEYFGKASVGIMIQAGADYLFNNGLLSGPPDEDKKEKALQYQAFPPEGINISGLMRMRHGGNPAIQNDDTWITYNKMGVIGVIFKMRARAGENREQSSDNKFTEFAQDSFSSLGSAASSALELSFLQGTNTLLTAIHDGKYDDWMVNTFNAVSSIPLPNTLASLNRVTRENLPELRDDKVSTRFENVLRSKLFLTGELPSKIDIWGNPVKQTPTGGAPAIVYHLFDVTRARDVSSDPASAQIYRLWKETGNPDVIPSIPSKTQTVEDTKVLLDPKQYEQLQMYIGRSRKALLDDYLENGYQDETNEERIESLKSIYEQGRQEGKDFFFVEADENLIKLNVKNK